MGVCHLCDQEKTLIDAHLLPKAFFRFLYPDSKIDDANPLIMIRGDRDYAGRSSIGVYDSNILCRDCDGFLGELDQLGKEIFLDTIPRLVAKRPRGDVWIFDDVDAGKLKLFLLSVLWRFSISKREETQNIKLPAKFESRLKDMIKDRDFGSVDEFSTVVARYKFRNPDVNLHKFFHDPVPSRMDGVRFWSLCIPNGYKVLIKADSRKQLDSLRVATLDIKKNEVLVIDAGFFDESPQFKAAIERSNKVN